MVEPNPFISELQALNGPRQPEALHILQKVASVVKPMMLLREWKVGLLAEEFEKDRLGCNWDFGDKITLCLRDPHDERRFLPFDEVVDTMLHELCHNSHSLHSRDFRNLWNQLRYEYQELVNSDPDPENPLRCDDCCDDCCEDGCDDGCDDCCDNRCEDAATPAATTAATPAAMTLAPKAI